MGRKDRIMSINRVSLLGHVGQNPEVRHTASGGKVANISIATNEAYKDIAGQRQERTEWHRVTAWGRLAEILQDFVHKGDQLYVSGHLQTRRWTDAQGVERLSTEIVAERMELLGGRKGKAMPEAFDPQPPVEDPEIPF
jgi:single-strand DNA-binding protein